MTRGIAATYRHENESVELVVLGEDASGEQREIMLSAPWGAFVTLFEHLMNLRELSIAKAPSKEEMN
jgi:hypothetical protein